jgi:hypothetical protein
MLIGNESETSHPTPGKPWAADSPISATRFLSSRSFLPGEKHLVRLVSLLTGLHHEGSYLFAPPQRIPSPSPSSRQLFSLGQTGMSVLLILIVISLITLCVRHYTRFWISDLSLRPEDSLFFRAESVLSEEFKPPIIIDLWVKPGSVYIDPGKFLKKSRNRAAKSAIIESVCRV